MVNPATDDVGEVNRLPNMANDGNTLAYMSAVPGNNALGGPIASLTVARREPGGWTNTPADLGATGPVYAVTGSTYPRTFSPDFTKALVLSSLPGTLADTNNANDAYVIDVGTTRSLWMSIGMDDFPQPIFAATPNLDRIMFSKGGSSPTPGMYASDGRSPPELLSRYEDGTPLDPFLAFPAGGWYQRGLNVDSGRTADPWLERNGAHGTSDDLRRVYFYDNFLNVGGGFLYLRDDAGLPSARTLAVSASQRTGDVGAKYRAFFISAAHNGAVAYFQSDAQLTDAATAGGGIYRYEVATQKLTQITPDAGPSGLALVGAISSDDQSHIYFTSTAALAGSAVAGDTNAYVWTAAGGVRFIAAVGGGVKFSRVTPDGRYALLLTGLSLGGAPTDGHNSVYRYDFVADRVVCVSCRPDGSLSQGDADIEAQSYGFPTGSLTHSRALTTDGDVVFTTSDRLVKGDQTNATDVYLYRNGTTSLLTQGRGDTNSFVGDISDDGKNIFVITRQALVASDRDAAEYDLYDVRVGGGFLEPPAPPEPCHNDDCRGTPTPQPSAPSPSSMQSAGAGNLLPAKVVKKLSLSRLTAAQRSSLARTGKVSLSVRVTGGGKLSVRARGKISGSRKTLGSFSDTVLRKAATTVKATVTLSKAARRELSRRGRLSVTLEARLGGLSKAVTTTANLTRAHR
jgi:hypothetical protein